jgi:hypothetical protein
MAFIFPFVSLSFFLTLLSHFSHFYLFLMTFSYLKAILEAPNASAARTLVALANRTSLRSGFAAARLFSVLCQLGLLLLLSQLAGFDTMPPSSRRL